MILSRRKKAESRPDSQAENGGSASAVDLICYGCVEYLGLPSSIAIPFTETDISIGWLYYPFVVLVIVGASNAVNLTDGLDGLAAGCCVIAFGAYALFCHMYGMDDIGAFAAVIVGCCTGFLFIITGRQRSSWGIPVLWRLAVQSPGFP